MDTVETCIRQKGWEDQRTRISPCNRARLLYNYLLHFIDDQELTTRKLASNLEKIRIGLIYNGKEGKNVEFVIEEMNKETAEIFTKLQLEKYIPS